MAADTLWELQKAVYAALTGDIALMALVTGVFDYPPHLAAAADPTGTATVEYPYVVIGECTAADFSTMGRDGMQHTLIIHTWSRYRGSKEAKQIMGAVHDVLHKATLGVVGHSHLGTMMEFAQVLDDPDGLTKHGVQRFRTFTLATV